MWTLSPNPRDVFTEAQLATRKAEFLKSRKFQLQGVQGSHTKRRGRNAEAEILNVNHAHEIWLGRPAES
jgi:hypothetical protein